MVIDHNKTKLTEIMFTTTFRDTTVCAKLCLNVIKVIKLCAAFFWEEHRILSSKSKIRQNNEKGTDLAFLDSKNLYKNVEL